MKHLRAAFVIVIAVLAVAVVAPGASAKYTLHNDANMTETDVVSGSEFNTCGDHISGRSAWSNFRGDLVNPPGASSPAKYEVFVFPPGENPSDFEFDFDTATQEGSYVRFDANGNIVETARRIAFTTAPLVLFPAGPVLDLDSNLYLYSNVAFTVGISPAAPVGSTVGIKPLGQSSRRDLAVVDCTPAPVIASIDAQPGLSTNPVNPASKLPTLVILVKGSAAFDVTAIATAKVGGAAPVTSGVFGVLGKPADLNADGVKDRLYFFRPKETGLTCSSRSVTIGGTLTSGIAWSGTDSVRPINCL
jgi:hypothetical protein